MINVDTALLMGHDVRNDNIELLRHIGKDEKAAPHHQLIALFEHYKFMLLSDSDIGDDILRKASMAWLYSSFFNVYGEDYIYREQVGSYHTNSQTFYREYILKVDPLLVALSFNSVAYLWFCTEEHDLVNRIIKRLIFLSSTWQEFVGDLPAKVAVRIPTPSGDKYLESHWAKFVPPFDTILALNNGDMDLRIGKLLPSGLVKCLNDIFIAYHLFKRGDNWWGSVPGNINYSVFIKICLNTDRSVKGLIDILKRVDTMSFDPEFMFNGLRWECTHTELASLLKSDQRGYNNQNVWLLLCYLNHTGRLTIDNGNTAGKYKWNVSDMSLGHAMFDYFVYHNKDSLLGFLNFMQYKRNRKFEDNKLKALVGLIKKYREFNLTIDPKKLKIKRGVLINFLSAGMGDIFCTP